MLSGKGAHKAGEICSAPSIPGQHLSLRTQDVSADLAWVDVTKGTEVKQEIVVREGGLCVGYAAVVT